MVESTVAPLADRVGLRAPSWCFGRPFVAKSSLLQRCRQHVGSEVAVTINIRMVHGICSLKVLAVVLMLTLLAVIVLGAVWSDRGTVQTVALH